VKKSSKNILRIRGVLGGGGRREEVERNKKKLSREGGEINKSQNSSRKLRAKEAPKGLPKNDSRRRKGKIPKKARKRGGVDISLREAGSAKCGKSGGY